MTHDDATPTEAPLTESVQHDLTTATNVELLNELKKRCSAIVYAYTLHTDTVHFYTHHHGGVLARCGLVAQLAQHVRCDIAKEQNR